MPRATNSLQTITLLFYNIKKKSYCFERKIFEKDEELR